MGGWKTILLLKIFLFFYVHIRVCFAEQMSFSIINIHHFLFCPNASYYQVCPFFYSCVPGIRLSCRVTGMEVFLFPFVWRLHLKGSSRARQPVTQAGRSVGVHVIISHFLCFFL